MTTLIEKIVQCHQTLAEAKLPHAFGGALALAWCTQQARGTIDIDINLFVEASQAPEVTAALPKGVYCSPKDLKQLLQDTQVRLFWDNTPVDVFLNSTSFHTQVQTRIRWENFAGARLPFLSCEDLAVFKAFFNRTKDWADLEAMADAGTIDTQVIIDVISVYLGADDERVAKLQALAT